MLYHENFSLENLEYLNPDADVCVEAWEPVKGYEDLYEVSDLGRVKGLARKMKHPTKAGYVTIKVCIIKPHLDKGGYLNVNFWISGKHKRHRTHQVVAVAFLGHVVDKFKGVVNHKDFNRQNNMKGNLEITTQRKNADQKHLPSASPHVGVIRSGRKWRAAIWIQSQQIHLGVFNNELDAAKAYEIALNEII